MQNPKPARYIALNPRITAFLLIVASIVTAVLIFTVGHASLFVEFEVTLATIALALFGFMGIGLYHGVRVEKDSVHVPEARSGSGWDWLYYFDLGSIPMPDVHHVGLPNVGDVGSGDDLVGCLVTILIWTAVTVVIIAIIAIVVPMIGTVIAALFAAIYWMFLQALRQVFARSRYCRGNWSRALGVSLLFTTIYTGWLFALIWASKFFLLR